MCSKRSQRATRCVSSRMRSFFFQAEDGIRDYKETGVQTCALPIFLKTQLDVRRDYLRRDPVNKYCPIIGRSHKIEPTINERCDSCSSHPSDLPIGYRGLFHG